MLVCKLTWGIDDDAACMSTTIFANVAYYTFVAWVYLWAVRRFGGKRDHAI
jgi:hypothetical protein